MSNQRTEAQRVGRARDHGGANKGFIAKVRQAYAEYRNGMGATAFAQEVGAALRELDRKAGK